MVPLLGAECFVKGRLLGPMPLVTAYLLTYSIVQSPSWEANWFAASQEIPRISRKPKVHYRTHKRPPPVSILSQPNPVHIPISHLLKSHPNIHPSTPRSPQWFPSLLFPHEDPIHPLSSPISATCHATASACFLNAALKECFSTRQREAEGVQSKCLPLQGGVGLFSLIDVVWVGILGLMPTGDVFGCDLALARLTVGTVVLMVVSYNIKYWESNKGGRVWCRDDTGTEFSSLLMFCYYVKVLRPLMLKDNLVSSHEIPPSPKKVSLILIFQSRTNLNRGRMWIHI